MYHDMYRDTLVPYHDISRYDFLAIPIPSNFSCFCRLLIFFFKINFFEKFFQELPSVSNSLDPYQARQFVRPDLGPNCLQKLSADDSTTL